MPEFESSLTEATQPVKPAVVNRTLKEAKPVLPIELDDDLDDFDDELDDPLDTPSISTRFDRDSDDTVHMPWMPSLEDDEDDFDYILNFELRKQIRCFSWITMVLSV